MKVIQHCLAGSDRFINHWIDHPMLLINLTSKSCQHGTCDPDVGTPMKNAATGIFERLDHHKRLISQHKLFSSGDSPHSPGTVQYNNTPSDSNHNLELYPENLDLNSLGVQDLTGEMSRNHNKPSPVAHGTFADVYKEWLPSRGE